MFEVFHDLDFDTPIVVGTESEIKRVCEFILESGIGTHHYVVMSHDDPENYVPVESFINRYE